MVAREREFMGCVCEYGQVCTGVIFKRLKPYFKVRATIFYVCEGSSQAIANQLNLQKIMVSIFLTMKAAKPVSTSSTTEKYVINFLFFVSQL
jgi:hypothetical protein